MNKGLSNYGQLFVTSVIGMKCKHFFALCGVVCMSLLSPIFPENYQHGEVDQEIYHGAYREIKPTTAPRVINSTNLFLILDYLYWKIVQKGTRFALQGGIKKHNEGTSNINKGEIQPIGIDWAWGFKVGGGINLNHNGWDLVAYYTWSRPTNDEKITEIDESPIFPLRFTRCESNEFNQFIAKTAQSNWDLFYNEINLEWGRNSHLNQFLTLRPFLGIKGTWQNQTFKSSYTGDDFAVRDSTGKNHLYTGPYLTEESFQVIGFGPRGGFDVKCYLSKGFNFFGHLAGTALRAHYYKQSRKDIIREKENPDIITIDLGGNKNSTKYVVECEIGFSWENQHCDNGYHFSAQVGWNSQIWFDWTKFFEPYHENWYNLNMNGTICKLRLNF